MLHPHIQPPMPPFERRLCDGLVGVAGARDDGLHDLVLCLFDDADEVESGDGEGVFAEDEAGGCVVDAHLGGVVWELERWVGGV